MTDTGTSGYAFPSVGCIPHDFVASHTGIELFDMMIAGKLPAPPIARTMNMTLAEASKGRAVFRGIPGHQHYNPLGSVHGGWAATILDSALGCAVHTMLPAGTAYATIEFKVNLVRPMFENTGEVVCTGTVIHFGRTIATSEAWLEAADGKLIAHGTETCAIFPMPPER
ncbi:MAG: PaaI family thioesterase [Rhizobiaceae bacterium]